MESHNRHFPFRQVINFQNGK